MMCLDITCRKCAGENLTRLTGAAVSADQLKVVLRCDDCGHEFGMAIVLFPVPIDAVDEIEQPRRTDLERGDDPACGTDYGYEKHGKNGTPRCPACRAAHTDSTIRYKNRRKALAAA